MPTLIGEHDGQLAVLSSSFTKAKANEFLRVPHKFSQKCLWRCDNKCGSNCSEDYRTKRYSAQKVESNHWAVRLLQIWSLHTTPVMLIHALIVPILDGTRTRSLRLRRPTPCPLGHEDELEKRHDYVVSSFTSLRLRRACYGIAVESENWKC